MVLMRMPSISSITCPVEQGKAGSARSVQPKTSEAPGCLLLVELSHGRSASKIGRPPLAGQIDAGYVTPYSRTVGVF